MRKLLTGMCPLMDLQVLRPREDFPAARKRAWKGFLSRVHPYVIDELVLGLERPAVTRTSLPETRVRGALGSAHVLHCKVRHDIVEGVEEFSAQFPSGSRCVLVYPHAGHFLPLSAGDAAGRAASASVASHVPQKSSVRMMTRMTDCWMLLMMDGRWG